MMSFFSGRIKNDQRVYIKNRFIKLTGAIFIATLVIGLTGCGFHHDDHWEASPNDSNQGAFLDSPVQGLHYETATYSGTTDANGYYDFMDGETVTFSMGGVIMGETMADTIMTPIDLVPGATDETHPTVTNMLRFMQTLDLDNHPENGITLPPHVIDELHGRPIHFDMDITEFEHDADIQLFMDTIQSMDENYAGRMMVSIDDAQAHMRNTMMSMMTQADDNSYND